MINKTWFCQDCRVLMIYSDKIESHICPECGVMVAKYIPGDKYVDNEIKQLMHDMRRNHKPREYLPAGEALPGGGGNKSRVKKPKSKKKSLNQLNNALYFNT